MTDPESLTSVSDTQKYISDTYDQIRKSIDHAQQELENIKNEEFTAESADHLVSATISGIGEITSLEIHVLAKRRMDRQTLSETITTVLRSAEKMFRDRQQDIFRHTKINGRDFGDMLNDPTSCVPKLERSD